MIRALMQKLGLDKIGEVLEAEARRFHVEVLEEERALLAKMIEQLDERIAGLGGKRRGRPPKAAAVARPTATIAAATSPTTRRPRRRKARITPKPGETLKDFVLKTLSKAGGPLNVGTLVDLVLEAGYKTNAERTTLVTSTYTVLTDKKLFRKMGKGVFGLVAAPAASRKAAKPKGRAQAIARKPGETLQVFVLRAFRKARGPMKASQVVNRVKTLGYRTASSPKNFLLKIYHVLADKTLFKKLGKGVYALALPSRMRGKVGRPKRRKRTAAKKASPAAVKEQTVEQPAPAPVEVKAE